MEKLRAALAFIRLKLQKTSEIASDLSAEWMAPNFPSPGTLASMSANLTNEAIMLVEKEALTAAAAGSWDGILGPWHTDSVIVARIARGSFKNTDKAAVWRPIRADGKSRPRITAQGVAIEKAWKASDMTWLPKTGLTYAAFGAHQTAAKTKAGLHSDAENAEAIQRGITNDLANEAYAMCVQWYEMATGAFAPDTPNGSLIRTIPTSYDPNQVPGRMKIFEHLSPGAGKVLLKWEAARAHHFNLYAQGPEDPEPIQILTEVEATEWLFEGLDPGLWKFEGEGLNAHGPGELSLQVQVTVAAAAAA